MKKTAEQKIILSATEGAKFLRVDTKIADDGNTVVITITSTLPECCTEEKELSFDELFPIVEASKLSLDDEFMKHIPESYLQGKIHQYLESAIESGLKDFRISAIDPSEDENGNIFFEIGNKPAIGHQPKWWIQNAEKFMPDKNSRIPILKEHIAFLGVLIKELVEKEDFSMREAWKAVCDDSNKIGHYWNSKNPKNNFEATGSRKKGRFYDLANTCKIIKQEENGDFLYVGGYYFNQGSISPLADIRFFENSENDYEHSVGRIVLDV